MKRDSACGTRGSGSLLSELHNILNWAWIGQGAMLNDIYSESSGGRYALFFDLEMGVVHASGKFSSYEF